MYGRPNLNDQMSVTNTPRKSKLMMFHGQGKIAEIATIII